MKKIFALALALILVFTLFACKPAATTEDSTTTEPTVEGNAVPKVVNIINGNLGDKSFFDSCHAGLQQLHDDGRIQYEYKEFGGAEADQPKWLQALYDFSDEGSYDLIICGTWQMTDYLKEVAAKYPDQMYLIYDSSVEDAATEGVEFPNVVNILYKQNDMGYIVGVFAASMTSATDVENINEDAVIGFLGGADGPVINDFLYGYILGAQSVNPDIKVDTRFVGDFVNTTKGKELALNMFNDSNCDIVWGVAGTAGNGGAEAAVDVNKWFIGVDSDQELTLPADQAARTLTSGLKNIGNSMIWLFDELEAGRTHYGEEIVLGIAEGGVGIVVDKNFAAIAPQAVQDAALTAQNEVLNGTVTVPTAMTEQGNNDVIALRETVKP